MKAVCAAALAVVAAACAPEPQATLRFAALDEQSPAYGTTPFPADLYLDDTGHLAPFDGMEDIAPLGSDFIAQHLPLLDGFGLRPVVEVFVDGEVQAASVVMEGSSTRDAVFVMNVDPASPERGAVVPMLWRVDPIRSRVVGVPALGVSLREKTRYATVVTRALLDSAGVPLAAPAAFTALRDAPLGDVPARWRATRDALADLLSAGLPSSALVAVSTFTTQHATRALVLARRAVNQVAAPTLRFATDAPVFRGTEALDALLGVAARDEQGRERWGWSNPTGMAHEHVGVIGTGVMTAPRFLLPDDGTFAAHSDAFSYDADSGAPEIVDAAAELPVTFALPASPAPASGYPVAIFAHGLGASRHQMLALAEPLTERGYAVVAIDMNGHGSRFADTDERNNTTGFFEAFSGDESVVDGFGDVVGVGSTFALLHEFKNLSAIRDSFRQSVLDYSALSRLLRTDTLDLAALGKVGEPAPRLDPMRVSFLGESFGGVVGSVLAAIEPGLDLFVLDVPGGGILDMALLGSPTMRPMVELWLSSTYGLDERLDRFHPLIGLGQALLDGTDPLSFAPHVLRDRLIIDAPVPPRHVVVLEVIGDEVMPNRATHALARAFGLTLASPFLTPLPGMRTQASPIEGNVDGQTGVLVQWAPATHGANWTSERGRRVFLPYGESDDEEYVTLEEAIEIDNPMRQTLEQVLAILDSHAGGATPRVPPHEPPVADFDGDGIPDDEEVAAGSDPYRPDR